MARIKRSGIGGNYRVGRGKPPLATQFKKGRSGNPAGRKKGSQNISTVLHKELNRTVTVREDGVARKMSKQDALLKSIIAKALQGDPKATQTVVNMVERSAAKMPAEPDMTVDATDMELLEKYLPYLNELVKRRRE
jgi:hypothetical protein